MEFTQPVLTVPRIPGTARARRQRLVLALGVVTSAFALGSEARGQVTARVSLATGGAQGNSGSGAATISPDGRFMSFASNATNLVAGDTNLVSDVFMRDRGAGTTERVSVATGGAQGNFESLHPSMSADGRFVAFFSLADNLVPGDTNGVSDDFVRDRQSGITERVNLSSAGTQGDAASGHLSISADGRYVAFASQASNLVAGDVNGILDVFVRDRQSGTTERVSVSSAGTEGNSASNSPSISADGRYVAFDSFASNLVANDSNGSKDVFVRDRLLSATERVSVGAGGTQGNSTSHEPEITPDGKYVVFESAASNLVVNDTNAAFDAFVRDRLLLSTERVSLSTFGGAQGNSDSINPTISDDGRFVAFDSYATNFVVLDTNGFEDVFVRDRQLGTTERVSVTSGGVQGDAQSYDAFVSTDGRYVAFSSAATDLVAGDTNATDDVFLRDRTPTGFTSLCHPRDSGVMDCPCSNPPVGPGRGCDNSSATGGAILTAAGMAYLSMDSLVFTTGGERPTATSLVLQGNASAAAGLVFGQGVRCAAGTLKRLYVKTASGGSITAPDLGAGDPTVSARSSALGDAIQGGESRWYLVYYRDPVVLGGCPVVATFNATQTGRVTWWL